MLKDNFHTLVVRAQEESSHHRQPRKASVPVIDSRTRTP